ncbi:MAG: hypothetical protein JO320_07905 [Alphaproteobacteria bacterium]|nr:hypothetical protein [Alphaproteobacteria bacterium]
MTALSCRAAIPALNRALEDRPDRVYDDLAAAALCLVQLRSELTARRREDAPGRPLERCNAILSMVVGGEYPLAGIRRERLQKARDELASLLDGQAC